MSHTQVRTQIYLPKKLKEGIERQSRYKGESMAEYIRRGMEKQVKKDAKKKDKLRELAERIFGTPVKKSGWAGIDSYKWIREERRKDDEYRMKRIEEARRK